MKTFHLTVAKVDEALFDGDAVSVVVPGSEGEMTILAEHTAIISALKAGVVRVKTETEELFFEIEGGTLEMSGGEATVLV